MRDETTTMDDMLLRACGSGEKVKVYMINGFCMAGTVVGFDYNCVTLATDGKRKYINRRLISTIEVRDE